MIIHGQLTAEDYRTAERVFMRSFIPVFATLATFALLNIGIGLAFRHWQNSIMTLILPGVFLSRYLLISRCSAEFYAKHLMPSGTSLSSREIKCKPEGISITGLGISRYIKLSRDIRTIKKCDTGILICAPFFSEIFPRRWFTAEEYTEFQAYLKKGQDWRGWISYLWRS